jgi:hypothetical protein
LLVWILNLSPYQNRLSVTQAPAADGIALELGKDAIDPIVKEDPPDQN